MVPFIQSPSSGSAAPGGSTQLGNEPSHSSTDHFDVAMNRALARDSGSPPAAKSQPPSRAANGSNRAQGTGPRPALENSTPQTPGEEIGSKDPDDSDESSVGHVKHSPTRKTRGPQAEPESAAILAPESGALPVLTLANALALPRITSASAGDATGGSANVSTLSCELSVDPKNPETLISTADAEVTKARGSADATHSNAPAPKLVTHQATVSATGQGAALSDQAEGSGGLKISSPAGPPVQAPAENASIKAPEQVTLAPPGPAPPDNAASANPSAPGGDRAVSPTPPEAAAAANVSPASGKEGPTPVGTSAAQQELLMKKAEKMQKSAELSQQNVPGDRAISAGKTEIPTAPTASAEVINNVPSDTRLISLEKTHDLVAMHALRLNHSANEAMRVVIEPGGGTRLSLELRFNNGTVEAQAMLHRGDFEFLSQHWSELQQRLSPRGVHLGTLECSTQLSADQHQPRHSDRQPSDEPLTGSAFAQFALDGSMSAKPASSRTRTKTHPGWETWA